MPASRAYDDLGPLQQDIMAAVWSLTRATVQDVRDRLDEAGRSLAYTTILSAMQKLEKQGWLDHDTDGRTYVYHATRDHGRERARSLRRTLRQLFQGDRTALLQQLLADDDVTDEELVELRRLIQTRREEVDR